MLEDYRSELEYVCAKHYDIEHTQFTISQLQYSFSDYSRGSGFYHAKVRHISTICPKVVVENLVKDITPNYSNYRIDLEKGSVLALKICFRELHTNLTNSQRGKEQEDDLIRRECTNPLGLDTIEATPLWSRVYSKSWIINIEAISLNGQRHKIEEFIFNLPTIINFADKEELLGEEEAKELAKTIITENLKKFRQEFNTFLNHVLKRFEEV